MINQSHTIPQLLADVQNLPQEKDWRLVRNFFASLEEHADELTASERAIFLPCCYELLFHERRAVRRIAGHPIGILLSGLGQELPAVWEDLLRRILFPEMKVDSQKSQWVSYSLMKVVSTAVRHLPESEKKKFLRIYCAYFRSTRWPESACLNLLGGIMEIPPVEWSPLQKHEIFGFMRQFLNGSSQDVAIMALLLLKTWMDQGWQPQEDELRYLQNYELPAGALYAHRYLLARLSGGSEESIPEEERMSTSEIQRSNLHLDHNWALKLVQMDILKGRIRNADAAALSSYASHLENLLRVNSHPMVFLRAGEDLLAIMPLLQPQQNYEIIQDELKQIEMGVDSANFLSSFLGRSFSLTGSEDPSGFMEKFEELLDNDDPKVVMTTLETISRICGSNRSGLLSVNIPVIDKKALAPEIRTRLLGLFARGLYSYRPDIAKESAFLADFYHLSEELAAYGCRAVTPAAREFSPAAGRRIAFFGGSFDPFTLRDRAIVEAIQEMGFEVCLSVHDFDWELNPQPARIRRRILEMTLADLPNTGLLAEDFPVYTGSPEDLAQLSACFPDRELWLVSSYTELEKTSSAACAYPHIIYSDIETQGLMDAAAIRRIIQADILLLPLPARFQEITPEHLKLRLTEGRDISRYADSQVLRMVNELQLYAGRPAYKPKAPVKELHTLFSESAVSVWSSEFLPADKAEEMRTRTCTGRITWKKAGRTAVITSITGDVTDQEDYRDLALMELLSELQRQGYVHVVCFDAHAYRQLLTPFGFLPMKEYEDGMTLDLSEVIVLFLDAASALKPPYDSIPGIRRIIRSNQQKLRLAVAAMYPGKLILSLPAPLINERLIRLIQSSGQVCVPFGKILKGVRVPGSITCELNTEKRYSADLSSFEICEFPDYPSLKAQIRSLASLHRPITLVDDLFHKGFRFEKIRELTEPEHIEIAGLIVSVESGRGRQLQEELGIPVQSLYQVPGMTVWLLESDLYPFVGGDGITEGFSSEAASSHAGALSSINTILPYQMPPFLKQTDTAAVYHFSEVCLTNSRDLFLGLEEEYRKRSHHTLTPDQLHQVMSVPRYPSGVLVEGSRQRPISELLQAEQKKLCRLQPI